MSALRNSKSGLRATGNFPRSESPRAKEPRPTRSATAQTNRIIEYQTGSARSCQWNSNSRRDNVSGVKLRWAHRLKVRVPAFPISILPECGFPCETRQLNFRVIEVRYERGVFLPQQNLWLDPWEAKDFAFVSHAHSDHI